MRLAFGIAALAGLASAQNSTNLTSLFSFLPVAETAIEDFITNLPIACPANESQHFFTLHTGFVNATVDKTWAVMGNFSDLSWLRINNTRVTTNATTLETTRVYEVLGENVTDVLFVDSKIPDGYVELYEDGQFSVNGTSFTKVLNIIVAINNTNSVGTHIIVASAGCASNSTGVGRTTYDKVFGNILLAIENRFNRRR
jgi:hypothetical protein